MELVGAHVGRSNRSQARNHRHSDTIKSSPATGHIDDLRDASIVRLFVVRNYFITIISCQNLFALDSPHHISLSETIHTSWGAYSILGQSVLITWYLGSHNTISHHACERCCVPFRLRGYQARCVVSVKRIHKHIFQILLHLCGEHVLRRLAYA